MFLQTGIEVCHFRGSATSHVAGVPVCGYTLQGKYGAGGGSGLAQCVTTPESQDPGIREMSHRCPLLGNIKHQPPISIYVHNN
jgi:hypothetical protein